MINYFIIPGLGNSGPDHWQSHFENEGPNYQRINQFDWDTPNCFDWIESINSAISGFNPMEVVLIGHSFGCSAIVHWSSNFKRIIRGALLVAPSDIENPNYVFPGTGFSPLPLNTLPFKSVVVASRNDTWVSLSRAMFFADVWGSEFVNLGDKGHINTNAGFGKWNEGLELLKRFNDKI